ncbi:ATP-grasp domain-containing protein [Microbispora sp. H11081]|uniref:ATP-grasp domain-containing protein n=1 Tax=Microbispora sp. H11081 TaxID=2729107 RepID=UPI0014753B92|nr:ATP-grasp domain-containing protein [Microbispora sp. H11081]
MRYALVADLHGRGDRLEPIARAAAGHGARLVLLGDYLDAKVSKRDAAVWRPAAELVDHDGPLWDLLAGRAAEGGLLLGNQEERIRDALADPGGPGAASLRPLLSAPARLRAGRALLVHGHEFDWFRVEGGVWAPKAAAPVDDEVTFYGHSHQPALIRLTTSPGVLTYEVLRAVEGVAVPVDGAHLVNVGPAKDGHWLLYDEEEGTVAFHGGAPVAGGRCRVRLPREGREGRDGRLVIIGGASPRAAARRLGVETLFVEHPARFAPHPLELESAGPEPAGPASAGPASAGPESAGPASAVLGERALLLDYERDRGLLGAMAAAHHRESPLAGALSMTEPGLLPAARLRDELGLPGASARTTGLLRDKRRMRALLDGRRGMAVAWAAGTGPADVERFAARHGYPCVVKPVDGAGSAAVTRVDGPAYAAEAARLAGPEFIVEEFLDGPEVSVESLSFGGEHVIVAVTGKGLTAGFVEISHVVPAPLPPGDLERVGDLVRTFLDLAGLQDGPAHTEVVLTAGGPRLVESHDRVGGDRINDLVRLAYGVDMVEAAVAWFAYGERRVTAPGEAARGAAVTFLTAPLSRGRGLVTAVDGVEEARAEARLVKVRVGPGDTVTAVRDSHDRLGYVLADGPTGPEALARSRALAARIEFTVKELPQDGEEPGSADGEEPGGAR